MKPQNLIAAPLASSKIRTIFRVALLLVVGTAASVLTPTFASRSEYAVAISLSNEDGAPFNGQYRVGDNIWLRVEIGNLSTETVNIPKGEDYTQPRVLRDGSELAYKKDVAERIKRHEVTRNYVDQGFWTVAAYEWKHDVVDLNYWFDLKPGNYQVYIDRLLPNQLRVQSNSISLEVLPALLVSNPGSPIVSRSVTPAYPAIAAGWAVSGTVLVDVEINPDGVVTSASIVSGPAMLRKPATDAAKLWLFNTANSSERRSTRLSFIFREASYEGNELGFKPPYEMAVSRAAVPVATKHSAEPLLKRTVFFPWRMGKKIF
jgi:TonB family protein